jgi:hypothetical protein
MDLVVTVAAKSLSALGFALLVGFSLACIGIGLVGAVGTAQGKNHHTDAPTHFVVALLLVAGGAVIFYFLVFAIGLRGWMAYD